MDDTTHAAQDIHHLIAARSSRRAYDPNRPVPLPIIYSLLEAARWAPSGNNRQSWRFYLARPHDPLRRDFEQALNPGNAWAKRAYLLILVALPAEFSRPKAYLDVGMAVENLLLQASAHGLVTRPMGGFNHEVAHATLGLPPDDEVLLMIAVGYAGNPDHLDDETRAKERKPRQRKVLGEIAFWADGQHTPVTLDHDRAEVV